MRKAVFTFFVLILAVPIMAGRARAADLQAGWYADIWGTQIYLYDEWGYPYLATSAWFYNTPPGQYGPFLVSDGQYHSVYQRFTSVPTAAYGVAPDESLVLPLWMPVSSSQQIAYLDIAWETNYDPMQMRLQLWRTRNTGMEELVWTQGLGGVQFGSRQVAHDAHVEGPWYWKVAVIPEPASCGALAMFVGALFSCLARRRR